MHGLKTLAWLHEQQEATRRFNLERNANNPGRLQAAEERLAKATEELTSALEGYDEALEAADEPVATRPDFSVARFGDDYWVLPLTLNAANLAVALFPEGTPRYGLHYVCRTPETRTIAASIITQQEG